jgi:hypothetical protein
MNARAPVLWLSLIATGALLAGERPKNPTEIDGYSVKLGRRTELGGPLVDVAVEAYEAEIAGKPAIVLAGHATSRLPSEFFKVTLTISCWDLYPETKAVFKRAIGKVVLTMPKPNIRTRWSTVACFEGKEGEFHPFAKPKPVYAVGIEFEPYVPRKQPKPDKGE